MKSIFLCENKEGNLYIGFSNEKDINISTFCNEKFLLIKKKINKSDCLNFSTLYQGLSTPIYILTSSNKKITGYIKSKTETSVINYSLFGTGILGIPNIIGAPHCDYILLKNPLNLPTKIHSELYQITAKKTLIYFDKKCGKESLIMGWNLLFNIMNEPKKNKNGDESLNLIINLQTINIIYEIWNSLNITNDKLVPSPVFFFLKKMGFDGIIDRYNNVGISISYIKI